MLSGPGVPAKLPGYVIKICRDTSPELDVDLTPRYVRGLQKTQGGHVSDTQGAIGGDACSLMETPCRCPKERCSVALKEVAPLRCLISDVALLEGDPHLSHLIFYTGFLLVSVDVPWFSGVTQSSSWLSVVVVAGTYLNRLAQWKKWQRCPKSNDHLAVLMG